MGTDRYCKELVKKENDISEWSINPCFHLALKFYLNSVCYLGMPRGNKYDKFDDQDGSEIIAYIFYNRGNVKQKTFRLILCELYS